MNESKYMLTNDFRILYCPNMKLKLSCKELDCLTMDFSKYNGNLDLLESFMELNSKEIDLIINNIFNAIIGIELNIEDMEWLKKFDKLLEEDINIINNKKIVFNYCVLKLKLIGFPEEMALNIAKTQFINQELNNEYPHYTVFIDSINEILDKRKFWISNTVNNFNNREMNFLRTIFTYKNKLQYKFDFNVFKNDYLNVVGKSFVPHLIKFNSTESYLIRNPLTPSKQDEYIIKSYSYIIIELINALLKKEFPNLLRNEDFIYDLINELKLVVKLYLKIQSQNEGNN